MALPLLPDPVDITIAALLAQSAVTALSPRVYSRIPGTPTFPLYMVSTVDESESGGEPVLGEARLQVDCWGAGNGATFDFNARLMARTVRAVARDLRGTYSGGSIVRADPGLIVPAPDSDTGRARSIVDLLVLTCP